MSNVTNKKRSTITAIALCTSVIFIVIAWVIGFATTGIHLSPSGWWELHLAIPLLWFLYLIPVTLAILTTNIVKKFSDEIDELTGKLNIILERGEDNARFAQDIGSGNYEVEFSADDDDVLGSSLLLMRDNLLENSKKEAEQLWISKGRMSYRKYCVCTTIWTICR